MECVLHKVSMKVIDAAPARALLLVLSQFPIGTLVQLSDGSKARVVRRNGDKYTLPIVQILEKADGTTVDPNDESSVIDLVEQGLRIKGVLPTPGRKELAFNSDVLAIKRKAPRKTKRGRVFKIADTEKQ